MKASMLQEIIDYCDGPEHNGAGYDLRVHTRGGHIFEGPHSGMKPRGGGYRLAMEVRQQNGKDVDSQLETYIDVEDIVGVQIIW